MNTLDAVICPGCGHSAPIENSGCKHCGYENGEDGRLLSIRELMSRPSYPAEGAMRLNDVSPAFIAAVVVAAQNAGVDKGISV
jgi:hypothetical protein